LLEINVIQKRRVASKVATTYGLCDTEQMQALNIALDNAIEIVDKSIDALNYTTVTSRNTADRYSTWFGNYTSANYLILQSNFSAISNTLKNEKIDFFCDCSDDIAYVFTDQPYKIHLCSQYWELEPDGEDSQAGTIIHEISHFDAVTSTDDHAYGHEDCELLAKDNPLNTLDNADSHEYFAENSPYIPMAARKQVHDIFADSVPYYSIETFALGNNSNAHYETGEPLHNGNNNTHSVWLSWVAPATGEVTIDTLGSTFDTVLAVYTGSQLDALTVIASNDDITDESTTESKVIINAMAGTTYRIAVDGYGGDTGEVRISIHNSFGDIDNDDMITLKDMLVVMQSLTESSDPNDPDSFSLASDINNDSRLGLEEAIFVLRNIAEL
jgi:hypothetical protein